MKELPLLLPGAARGCVKGKAALQGRNLAEIKELYF